MPTLNEKLDAVAAKLDAAMETKDGNSQEFKPGDKVRDIKFGKTYTVLFQLNDVQVFVGANTWIHPANLRKVK